MTAEEIELPAVGKVKREYLYAAGALVVGIAGYAWWHARGQSSGGGSPLVVNGNDVIPATDRVTPPSGDSSATVDGTAGQITTNAQWTTYVVEKLAAYGYDPVNASASLGKWISRGKDFTATDVETIQRGVGLAGYPPENGPWTIPAVSTTTPTTNLPKPDPDATGVLGNRWDEFKASDKYLSGFIHRVYGTPFSDAANMAINDSYVRAANPQVNFNRPLVPGTPIFAPGIPK